MQAKTDERFIQTPSGRVRCLRWQGGEGAAPILLLHSLGQEADAWRTVAEALSPTRVVYALDLPGHGRSDRLREPGVRAVADAVAPALATLAQEAPGLALGAHAYAAPVVAECLARLPAGLGSSLTFVCAHGIVPPAGSVLPDLPWAQAIAARALARRPERVRAAVAALCARPERVPPAAWSALSASLGRADALWRFGPALIEDTPALLPALGTLGRQARFIWCEADPVFPAAAAEAEVSRAAREGPRHRQARLADAGHLPMLEAPDRLARHLGALPP